MGMRALFAGMLAVFAASPSPAAWQLTPTPYFPSSYENSLKTFSDSCRKAAGRRKGLCRSFGVGADLEVGYGYFTSGRSRRLVVIQSGIHGVEAPAGAAVQQVVFDKYLERFLDAGVDVALIHGLNPWGFKHGRRVDEANVDLNRNFGADSSAYATVNDEYESLRWLLEPSGQVVSSNLDSLMAQGMAAVASVSGWDIGKAMSGQYEYPDGLNYGGRGPRPQVAFLRQTLAPMIARYPDGTIFLDVHTGLGKNGVLHVMTGVSPEQELLTAFKGLWGSLDGVEFTTASDPGFFPTTGDVIDFIPTLAPSGKVLALTMEFGTMGDDTQSQLKSVSRIVLENKAHHNGCLHESMSRDVKADFREMFTPSDSAWRAAVISRADAVFARLLEWR